MKPKYIRVASDLHLEQHKGQSSQFLAKTFLPPDPRDAESVLCLAGDISSKPEQLIDFIRELELQFQKIYYVPGNHEFYGHNMETWSKNLSAALGLRHAGQPATTEFSTLDVSYEELENVRFIFGTLWADGGKTGRERAEVGRGLRDFYVVKVPGRLNGSPIESRFTVSDMEQIFLRQRKQIEEFLKQPFNGITVVMTHHMPSLRLCHPRFGNEINGGFASNLDPLLASDDAPEIWIHGHTHDTIDTRLWKTRVVCNPAGYYFEKNADSRYNRWEPKFLNLEDLNEDRSAFYDLES